MRVASWNVLNTNNDTARLRRFVETVDADVIALQELTPAHIAALRNLRVGHLYLAEDFAERGETSFLGILSRTPALHIRALDHNPGRNTSDSLLGNRMQWIECLQSQSVVVATGLGPVCVVNLHLSCAVSPQQRKTELQATAPHFSGVEKVVVCGDFNSFARPWLNPLIGWALGFRPRDRGCDERAEIRNFAAQHGLRQAFPSAITFPRFGLHLDHVLVRGMNIPSGRVYESTFGSDHRPVVAELAP